MPAIESGTPLTAEIRKDLDRNKIHVLRTTHDLGSADDKHGFHIPAGRLSALLYDGDGRDGQPFWVVGLLCPEGLGFRQDAGFFRDGFFEFAGQDITEFPDLFDAVAKSPEVSTQRRDAEVENLVGQLEVAVIAQGVTTQRRAALGFPLSSVRADTAARLLTLVSMLTQEPLAEPEKTV